VKYSYIVNHIMYLIYFWGFFCYLLKYIFLGFWRLRKMNYFPGKGGGVVVQRRRRYEISHCFKKLNVIWKAKKKQIL
jgi:hypothetical protein